MNNKNDIKILNLKEQINTKREKLKRISRFNPITNCSIEINGVRYNINALNKQQLTDLMIDVNIKLMSVKNLEIEYLLCGYKLEEWLGDIKSKLEVLSKRDEESKLKVLEDKLNKLLSEEKKVELELDEIENML